MFNSSNALKLKFTTFLLVFLSLTLLIDSKVHAQSTLGMQVSPPSFELSGNPGDVIENTIKITNLTDGPLDLIVEKRNFTAVGEEGAIELTDEETSFSLASWIEVSPDNASLGAGETQLFTFTVSLPLNAEPGGHFGSVIFKTGGDTPTNGSGASVAQEVASLVLMRVAGDVDEKATISSFTTDSDFYEYGPVVFDLRVENSGTVHVKPTGTITISNMFGKEVETIEVTGRNVLPGAARRLSAQWNTKYLFGNYTATSVLRYGTDNQTITSTVSFMAMPYKVVLPVAFVLFLVLLFAFKSKKRLGKALKVLMSG